MGSRAVAASVAEVLKWLLETARCHLQQTVGKSASVETWMLNDATRNPVHAVQTAYAIIQPVKYTK